MILVGEGNTIIGIIGSNRGEPCSYAGQAILVWCIWEGWGIDHCGFRFRMLIGLCGLMIWPLVLSG